MADGVFNIAKGAVAEMFRDSAADGLVLLLTANEAEATLIDRDTITLMVAEAGTTEAVDGSYGRKTGLTGTITVDDTNDRVDVDIPDQTWTALAGAAIVKAIVCFENAAADTTRIPCTHHDFAVTPDSSDVTIQFNAAGFYRAS